MTKPEARKAAPVTSQVFEFSLVIGHWSLVVGHWSLVIGRWSLVIGHWSLVVGRWSLVIGHWVLVVAAIVSPFASPLPDGLEASVSKLGFDVETAEPVLPAPFAEYNVAALETLGIAGSVAGARGWNGEVGMRDEG